MDYLELFAGAGGGLQAHFHLMGHTPVAAAEVEDYPLRVLRKRMAGGQLPQMKIYTDVHAVDGTKYRGIGGIAGGSPCQDISPGGSKLGLVAGPKSKLFFEMARIINEAQPQYVYWENSDRARTNGLNHVCQVLQAIGYGRMAWGTIGAADLGAPYMRKRKRMWLVARRCSRPSYGPLPKIMPADGILDGAGLAAVAPWVPRRKRADMPTITAADARNSGNRPDPTSWSLSDVLGTTSKHVRHSKRMVLPTLAASDFRAPYSTEGLLKQLEKRSKPLRDILPFLEGGRCIAPLWAEWYQGWCPDWTDLTVDRPEVDAWRTLVLGHQWWKGDVEKSVLPRTLPERPKDLVGRITALGNAQVPIVAATAFTVLKEALS